MYGTNLEAGIKSVKVRVTDVDGRTLRRCLVVLAVEFTDDIARQLGGDARSVLKGLRSGGIEKAQLPIERVAAHGAFTGNGDAVAVGSMLGTKAVCLPPKDEGDNPTIQLEFEFAWDEGAWLFLGRNCASTASVILTERQTTFPEAASETRN